MWPVLSTKDGQTLARKSETIFILKTRHSLFYAYLLVRNSASTFRGGYYSHGKQFIAKLPIRRIDFSDGTQKALHDRIVEKVHQLESLNEKLNDAQNSTAKKAIDRAAKAIQNELSAMVDGLYGVEEDLWRSDTDEAD